MEWLCKGLCNNHSLPPSSAMDNKLKEKVAVKKSTPFHHPTYCQRTYRELKILLYCKHENIIDVKNVMIVQPNLTDMKDIYIVQTFMDTDLHKLLKSTELSPEHICFFLYQLLLGVKYIHSANVLHRDLKPSNLLINTECDLKICDFGLARISDPDYEQPASLTEYVATRWYRAPEIMLNSRSYNKSVDLWSVGCILGEMFTRKAMFPGHDYMHQLTLHLNLLGYPKSEDQSWIVNAHAKRFLERFRNSKGRPLHEAIPKASSHALDLISRLLTFNPHRRITVEQALEHPYVEPYHEAENEPVVDKPFDFDCTLDGVPMEDLKKLVLDEMKAFKEPPPQAKPNNPSTSTAH